MRLRSCFPTVCRFSLKGAKTLQRKATAVKKADHHREQITTEGLAQSEIRIFYSSNVLRPFLPARVNPVQNNIRKASWRMVTVQVERVPKSAFRSNRKALRARIEHGRSDDHEFDQNDLSRIQKLKDPNRAVTEALRHEIILSEEVYEERYRGDKEEARKTLEDGNLDDFFFYLLFYGPRLLAEPAISSVIQNWWWTKAQDREAQAQLRDLCDALMWKGRDGRPPDLTEEERPKSKRLAVSIANAVKIRVRWYEDYKKQGKNSLQAYKLTIEKHKDSRHIADPTRKTRIQTQFRKKVMERDAELRRLLGVKAS